MSYYYLATPYSKWSRGIVDAYEEACRQTGVLLRAGVPVFSPIAMTHGVAIHSGLDPLDHTIWMPADTHLMRAAKGLIVCKMDGWDRSYGIGLEIEEFERAGKPIIYMEPGVVPELHQNAGCLIEDTFEEKANA